MHICIDYISEPIKSLKPSKQNLFTQMFKKAFRVHPLLPVVRCGEGCHDNILPIDVDDVRHGLQDVEVEVRVARDGAVQAGLEEGGPLLLQDAGRAAAVVLTHPRHPRKHHLTTTVETIFNIPIRHNGQQMQWLKIASFVQYSKYGKHVTHNAPIFYPSSIFFPIKLCSNEKIFLFMEQTALKNLLNHHTTKGKKGSVHIAMVTNLKNGTESEGKFYEGC